MDSNCIFCKIISGEIPTEKVFQDEQVIAFRDIRPSAPVHVLIVPKQHIPSVNELTSAGEQIAGHLILAAQQIARQEGVDEDGYRLVINNGQNAGQEVAHLHLHLLGGQRMQYPLG